MEDLREKRVELREQVEKVLGAISAKEKKAMLEQIETRLFEFANFLESRIALLYISGPREVDTAGILRRSHQMNKLVVLPAAADNPSDLRLMKIDNPKTDLKPGADGLLAPNPDRCRVVPIDCIDIAIIPGLVFDEKGGRIGTHGGFYNKLIGKLPATTRKVALAFEKQIVAQVPMESSDRFVDIIISDQRIIYKI
ncbi:MAG: 5-formyltetrahydrofolate cyclo-ligase [Desulfobacterales bacterium]|nr:5-formyltetrahydrofolate cyclo-ligase [Desulfobacterales bacterium]